MVLVRLIFVILFCSILFYLYDRRKHIIIPIKVFLYKIKIKSKRIYRLLSSHKSNDYVWQELNNHFKSTGLRFGQYNKDKQITCSFRLLNDHDVYFEYTIKDNSLCFRSVILSHFDVDFTNDLLVLASHFNGNLSFGVVKANTTYNHIIYQHQKDILIYSLFPDEIKSDMQSHLEFSKDVAWAFHHLIETGDDPVFVFSEFLKRLDPSKISN